VIALLFAVALFVPGPGDPVCEPGQSVEVDHCAQGQLPGETIGREIDAPPVELAVLPQSTTPATPTTIPAEHLAYTGVPVAPYGAAAVALVAAGSLACRVSVRRRTSR
jgi:hypothetical protein